MEMNALVKVVVVILVVCALLVCGVIGVVMIDGERCDERTADVAIPTVMPIPPLPLIRIEESVWE